MDHRAALHVHAFGATIHRRTKVTAPEFRCAHSVGHAAATTTDFPAFASLFGGDAFGIVHGSHVEFIV